jgi:hypothetical protein
MQRQAEINAARSRGRRAVDFMKNGHISRAASALLQGDRLELTEDLIPLIDKLFVKSDAWRGLPAAPSPTSVPIDADIVRAAIKALARGQSRSVSGLAPDHFLPLVNDKVCIDSLVIILHAIAHGQLPDDVRSILTRGRLVILAKPNGGLRPITVPEPLLMLAEHICLEPCQEYLDSILQPLQLGVGAPSGVDTAAHLMQQVVDSGTRERSTAVILIDITNAYGTISRRAMLQALYKHSKLRSLWHIAHWSLTAPAVRYLRMDDGSIKFFWQEEGGAQGSVIMPALFAVALQPLLIEATRGLNLTTVGILDDIASGGDLQDVMKLYDKLKVLIERELGSKVNAAKTVLVPCYDGPPTAETVAACAERNITIEEKGAKYVGAWIGRDDQAKAKFVMDVVQKHRSMCDALVNPHLPVQIAMTLLRFCALPKVNHLLRTMAPQYTVPAAKEFDSMMVKAMATVLHQPGLHKAFESMRADSAAEVDERTVNSLLQALLPIRMGGTGLVMRETIAEAAYLGSYVSCAAQSVHFFGQNQAGDSALEAAVSAHQQRVDAVECAKKKKQRKKAGTAQHYCPPAMAQLELAHIQSAINHLHEIVPGLSEPNPDADDEIAALPMLPTTAMELLARGAVEHNFREKLQARLTIKILDGVWALLLSRTTDLGDRARLNSVTGRGAQRAFTVLPTRPAYELHDIHYRLAQAYRLGMSVVLPNSKGSQLCVCGYLTTDNAHAHGCPPIRAQSGIAAHDKMVSLLVNQFTRAGEQVMKEVMLPSGKRMDAKVFMQNRVLNIDVSMTCPSVKSYKAKASEQPMAATYSREAYKCSKYEHEIDKEGGDFVPFVMETYGAMSATVHRVASLIEDSAINNCVPNPPTKQEVLNELAVQLQRGNAMCLIKAMSFARQSLGPWFSGHGV